MQETCTDDCAIENNPNQSDIRVGRVHGHTENLQKINESALTFPGNIKLQPADLELPEIETQSFFGNGPVIICAIRRPTCFLCRRNAAELMKIADSFKENGARMVAICKESYGIDTFKEIWTEEIYIDYDMDVFKFIWGGQLNSNYTFVLDPQFWINTASAWEYAVGSKSSGSDMNGEGFTLGGICVTDKDGKIKYRFLEAVPGDRPSNEDVLDAVISCSLESSED